MKRIEAPSRLLQHIESQAFATKSHVFMLNGDILLLLRTAYVAYLHHFAQCGAFCESHIVKNGRCLRLISAFTIPHSRWRTVSHAAKRI